MAFFTLLLLLLLEPGSAGDDDVMEFNTFGEPNEGPEITIDEPEKYATVWLGRFLALAFSVRNVTDRTDG